jgi:hypothetical protein
MNPYLFCLAPPDNLPSSEFSPKLNNIYECLTLPQFEIYLRGQVEFFLVFVPEVLVPPTTCLVYVGRFQKWVKGKIIGN